MLHSAGTFSGVLHKMINKECSGLCYIYLVKNILMEVYIFLWINEYVLYLIKGIEFTNTHPKDHHAHDINKWLYMQ